MILIIFIAFLYGAATVVSKMLNYRATLELGTWNGSMVNYVVASLLAFIMLLFTNRFQVSWDVYAKAPLHLYAGGAFGVIAFVISLVCLKKMEVFRSTILLLVGNLVAGILFDIILFQNFTLLKFFGVLLVASGIFWDNKLTSQQKGEK